MISRYVYLLCILLSQWFNFITINAYLIHSISLMKQPIIKYSRISDSLTLYLFNNRKMIPIDQPNDKKSNNKIEKVNDSNVLKCKICNGKEVIDCKFCLGTGKDKINGNVLERWTCNKCKGSLIEIC